MIECPHARIFGTGRIEMATEMERAPAGKCMQMGGCDRCSHGLSSLVLSPTVCLQFNSVRAVHPARSVRHGAHSL
jgi:hypothetical protein